jgi:hypothetical protein
VKASEIEELAGYMTAAEREEFERLLVEDMQEVCWRPLPGPQTLAYNSEADVIGFGGAAGGGKTDLACGLALTSHYVAQIFRREGTEVTAIVDRMTEIVGHRDGLGGKPPLWRDPNRQAHLVEFGSVPNLGDEKKYQGRAKDLLVIDEAANFLEIQVRFLMGWVRSTRDGQRKRTLLTFNPPTAPEGRWILDFFGPWIHPRWPKADRATPGEIRFVGVVPGENGVSKDIWVKDGRQFVIVDGAPCYDFDPADYQPQDIVTPQSRTFIPSRITDNPHLVNTGYMGVLQAMPEPLRSQMLYGDFSAGLEDDAFQVIPTAWVEAAMKRWVDRSPKGEMLAMGVDVARGGKDASVIARRHTGWWFDKLIRIPGHSTPDSGPVVGQIVANRRDSCPVHVDGIGVGAAVVDKGRDAEVQVVSVNVAEKSLYRGRAGNITFYNLRSELVWRMRELLDPQNDMGAALPPDDDLLTELTIFKWCMKGKAIYVTSREEIVEDIGRSPDSATAVILAQMVTPNLRKMEATARQRQQAAYAYDPIEQHARSHDPRSTGYDPLANY